jgi:hypothetical protein
MSVKSEMTEHALAEYDRLVVEREREIRLRMAATGASQSEIDAYFKACQPSLANQREGIGRLVTVELMKAGVPLATGDQNVGA